MLFSTTGCKGSTDDSEQEKLEEEAESEPQKGEGKAAEDATSSEPADTVSAAQAPPPVKDADNSADVTSSDTTVADEVGAVTAPPVDSTLSVRDDGVWLTFRDVDEYVPATRVDGLAVVDCQPEQEPDLSQEDHGSSRSEHGTHHWMLARGRRAAAAVELTFEEYTEGMECDDDDPCCFGVTSKGTSATYRFKPGNSWEIDIHQVENQETDPPECH